MLSPNVLSVYTIYLPGPSALSELSPSNVFDGLLALLSVFVFFTYKRHLKNILSIRL